MGRWTSPNLWAIAGWLSIAGALAFHREWLGAISFVATALVQGIAFGWELIAAELARLLLAELRGSATTRAAQVSPPIREQT